MKLRIIGPGKVGKTLYRCLREHLDDIEIFKRNYKEESLKDSVILLTVPDDQIKKVWNKIKKIKIKAIGHTSGAKSCEIFKEHQIRFSMHPNYPFTHGTTCEELKGIIWGVEGTKEGKEIAKILISILKGETIDIPLRKKVDYHLSAVLISNFSYVLYYLSKRIYEEIGIEKSSHLLDLGIRSFENIKRSGLKDAITGPVVRGDWEIVEKERELFVKYFKNEEVYNFFVKKLKEIKEDNQ